MRVPRFLFVWLALWLFACAPVAAQDLVERLAFFQDPDGTLTLEQVKAADFSDAGKIISLGYTRSTVWVKLTLVNSGEEKSAEAKTLAVRVFPAHLESMTLFSEASSHETGEGLQLSGRTTWFTTKPDVHVLYLRVKTSGPMLLAPRVLSQVQAHDEDVSHGLLTGALFTCCLLVLSWLLFLIAKRQQALHVVLLINLSLVVTLFFAWTGYGPAFFTHPVTSFLGLLNVLTGFMCWWLIFRQLSPTRWIARIFIVLASLYLPLMTAFFVADRQAVLMSSTFLALLASLVCLFLTVLVFKRQQRSTWWIGGGLLLAMGLSARWFLTLHGYLAPKDSLVNLLFFRIFFAMLFVSITLLLLNRERRHQRQALVLKSSLERQRLALETQRRQTQERFMTMLMHELKTPLSIIQLAATSLGRSLSPESGDARRIKHINRAVDDLNALVECCANADQIDQGAVLIKKESLCAASLIREAAAGLGFERVQVQAPAQFWVSADAHYLRLILLNLLSNALKYSPPLSPVVLELSASAAGEAGCDLRIVNEVGSAGVPDAALLFSRYYRAEGARRQVGAGLGLWLTQSLARQMGAELRFHHTRNHVVFGLHLESA